jgi:hypothetical protein
VTFPQSSKDEKSSKNIVPTPEPEHHIIPLVTTVRTATDIPNALVHCVETHGAELHKDEPEILQLPGAHDWHMEDPAIELNFPISQSMHVPFVVFVGEYVPKAHPQDLWPSLEKVPSMQLKHTPDFPNLPLLQGKHVIKSLLVYPSEQLRQLDVPPSEYLNPWHEIQLILSTVYFP